MFIHTIAYLLAYLGLGYMAAAAYVLWYKKEYNKDPEPDQVGLVVLGWPLVLLVSVSVGMYALIFGGSGLLVLLLGTFLMRAIDKIKELTTRK